MGIDELGASSVGAAIGLASTIGWCDSGAVCKMMPLCPSLMPLCVSSTSGCPLDMARAIGAAQRNASDTTAWTIGNQRIERQRNGRMGTCQLGSAFRRDKKTLYLTLGPKFSLARN